MAGEQHPDGGLTGAAPDPDDAGPADAPAPDTGTTADTGAAAAPPRSPGGGHRAGSHRSGRSAGGSARLPWSLAALSAVLVVLLAVAVVVRAGDISRHRHDDATRAAVLAAAVGAVPPLLSYDYTTIAGQAKVVDPHLTAAYRTKYNTSLQQVVSALVVANKAVLNTTVITDSTGPAAAIRSMSGNRASVLVFINQSSTNDKRTATRLEQTPVVLSMVKVAGSWLVDDLVTDAAQVAPTPSGTPTPSAGTSTPGTPPTASAGG